MNLDRRSFLIGLFGTAAVAAAGPLPNAIKKLSDEKFVKAARAVMPRHAEIYGNGKDYAFATIKYLNEPPYFSVIVPKGFRPLRDESDRLGAEAIQRMYNK